MVSATSKNGYIVWRPFTGMVRLRCRNILRSKAHREVLFDTQWPAWLHAVTGSISPPRVPALSISTLVSLEQLTVQGIKTIVAQNQSHADVDDFIRRIKEAYPVVSAERSRAYSAELTRLYSNYTSY